MIRKLWLELRWVFPVLPLFLIFLTLEYTWVFQHSSIMTYNDQTGEGIYVSGSEKDTGAQDAISTFLKEHPQGQILSLKTTPLSYFIGFDALARIVLPFLVAALCAGGILSEKSSGTASFALSLPVSRSSWLWSRAAALLFLTAVTVLLACTATFTLAALMGVEHKLSWLVTESLLLTLGAAPWIGVSLYVQSWFSGRFDSTGEAISALAVTAAIVFVTEAALLHSPPAGAVYPILLLWDVATAPAHTAVWKPLMVTGIVGIGGMLLAIRRFERMDF